MEPVAPVSLYRFAIEGICACMAQRTPRRSTSTTLRATSAGMSGTRAWGLAMPALLIATSSPPSASAAFTSSRCRAGSQTSPAMQTVSQSRPAACASSASAFRSLITIFAPCAASICDSAMPKPPVAPVRRTVSPVYAAISQPSLSSNSQPSCARSGTAAPYFIAFSGWLALPSSARL